MDEIWKDIYYVNVTNNEIIDYRGLYQVSNLGRIKSLNYNKTKKEKILALAKKEEYDYVTLNKNGKGRTFLVHRIVAFMFVPNSENKEYVDHIIPIKNGGTNESSNLKWVTAKENSNNKLTRENMSKSRENKFKGVDCPALGQKIVKIDKDTKKIIDIKYNFEYGQEGYNCSKISACCKDKRKSHSGFIFKYLVDIQQSVIDDYYNESEE